ncbi:MAG: M50 family metallopeptidase [Alphaproteobacteria bacterium]
MDKFVDFLKWPAALFVLCFMPAVVKSFSYFDFFSLKNAAFLGGFLLFVAFSATLDKQVKSSLQTFSHELTHAFFAILTFHEVTSIKLHDEGGGAMSFKGKGNWLILVAPYFFPLFLFAVIVVLSFYNNFDSENFLTKGYYPLFVSFSLGVLTGAHFDMIGSQVHDKQTDLHKLGLPFSLLFIIPSNAMVMGFLFAFNSKGLNGLVMYFDLIVKITKSYIAYFL